MRRFRGRRPGNQLRPGEDEIEGMKTRLNHQLGPPPGMGDPPQWEVGELVACWWRPKAENYLVRALAHAPTATKAAADAARAAPARRRRRSSTPTCRRT